MNNCKRNIHDDIIMVFTTLEYYLIFWHWYIIIRYCKWVTSSIHCMIRRPIELKSASQNMTEILRGEHKCCFCTCLIRVVQLLYCRGIIAANCENCWKGTLKRTVQHRFKWISGDANNKSMAPPAVRRCNQRTNRRGDRSHERGHTNCGLNVDNHTRTTYIADFSSNRNFSPRVGWHGVQW